MELNSQSLAEWLDQQPPYRRLIIGYSGGLDSHVLLHLLSPLQPLAVHVNHGLQADSADWGRHCAAVCHQLGVPYHQIDLELEVAAGESTEAVARDARYQAFESVMQPGDLVLLAQHQDDQAETLMLQLLRGSGVEGLAGMPRWRSFGRGGLGRPLLDLSGEALKHYAEKHALTWIEDPSNTDLSFDRNFLRNQVFPLLRSRWPSMSATLARSAAHCATAGDLIQSQARAYLHQAMNSGDATLSLKVLSGWERALQRRVLRQWITHCGYQPPGSRRLESALDTVLSAAIDRNPVVRWSGVELRRYRERLYLIAEAETPPPDLAITWSGEGCLTLPQGLGELSLEPVRGGIAPGRLEGRQLSVRFNHRGVSYRPAGSAGGRKLSRFFQEQGIPPWERPRIPMLYADDELVALGDLLVNGPYRQHTTEPGVALLWRR